MTENTVFVIGAGASKEANLPTGDELKGKISTLLDIRFDYSSTQKSGDYEIIEALRLYVQTLDNQHGDINAYLHEAWLIRDALPLAISIDNFIDAHRDNDKIAVCGKLAIVRSILNAERNSHLFFEKTKSDSNINLSRLEATWYLSFFKLLTENCQKNELTERFKSLTLIVFNYDRCIEHFIYHALQKYYKLSASETAELVKNINIYHPYGKVGNLPWEHSDRDIEFGAEPNPHQLLELSQKIKTFTEGTDPEESEIIAIRNHMNLANKVVFLGFAFHKLNMELITPTSDNNSKVKCFATTYGFSDSDKTVINRQIKELYQSNISYEHDIKVNMANLTCGKFFTDYSKSLSF
jgi:hypothetical protein